MIYLAAPYSHPDPDVRVARFNAINAQAAAMMQRGEMVFSPISHSHPIAMAGTLPEGWDYWQAVDEFWLSKCDGLVVLMLEGWGSSVGVQNEIHLAKLLGLWIDYVEGSIE